MIVRYVPLARRTPMVPASGDVTGGPAPASIETWLVAWLVPEAETASAVSRPPSMPGSVLRNRMCLAAAQLLHRIADALVTSVLGTWPYSGAVCPVSREGGTS